MRRHPKQPKSRAIKPITPKEALGTVGTRAAKLNTRRGQLQVAAAALIKRQEE